jgi:ABC-2 type transport system ATP-binding protein
MAEAPILEIRSVRQEFRTGFWLKRAVVLNGIELKVPRRAVYGFLGANGAGKTTLIQLIVGTRRPTGGSILVCGHAATTPQARSRIGFLPERPYFHDHLTGEGLLQYFGRLSGMDKKAIERRIPEVLAEVGMTAARKVELRRYSKGMLQRIGIAQAILHDPEFLVLDEPMSGLDPLGRKEIRELILKLARGGRTIFFSSHVISDIEAICDQAAIIRTGRLLGAGPIRELLTDRSEKTEIVFSGLSPERAQGLPGFVSIRVAAETCYGQVSGRGNVDQAVRQVLEAGGSLISVIPQQPSLEEIFSR